MKEILHKQRIYIDTSVIGGCFDDVFKEWSNKLFDEFINGIKIAVLSDISLREIEDAPENVKSKVKEIPEKYSQKIPIDDEVINLANEYVNANIVTRKSYNDAIHIALATVNKIDILVSWNFRHIVNFNKIRLYNSINLQMGYNIIEIRTPREVVNED